MDFIFMFLTFQMRQILSQNTQKHQERNQEHNNFKTNVSG